MMKKISKSREGRLRLRNWDSTNLGKVGGDAAPFEKSKYVGIKKDTELKF